MGQSAVGGALGGAFSFGVGQMFGHGVTDLGQFATKTVAHGVSGGLQNMIQGGDFGSGFMSGSVGHATGFVGGSIGGDVGGIVGSGLGGGISSSLSGGDFGRGFQTGAMQYLFNRMGEGIVDAGVDFLEQGARSLDRLLAGNSASISLNLDYFGVGVSATVGQGALLQKSIISPALGVSVSGAYNPGGGKNLVKIGWRNLSGGLYLNDHGGLAGFHAEYGRGLPIPAGVSRGL